MTATLKIIVILPFLDNLETMEILEYNKIFHKIIIKEFLFYVKSEIKVKFSVFTLIIIIENLYNEFFQKDSHPEAFIEIKYIQVINTSNI